MYIVDKTSDILTKGGDGAFNYRGKRVANFSVVQATKYTVLDATGDFHSTIYNMTVLFADSHKERVYVSALGDIESGNFFKIHREFSIFAEKTYLIRKLIAEFIMDIATSPEKDVSYISTMGWFGNNGQNYYLGYDGAVGKRGFTANLKSTFQEALPLQGWCQAQVCEHITAVNRLLGFSWEDRLLFLNVLASVLDGILKRRLDYYRTGLIIIGAKGSGKTSLVKKWFGVPMRTTVITSGGNLQHLIEGVSVLRDWHFIVDDLALEKLTKEKAIKNLTETVQSYYDGKPIGSKNQIINAKPICTTERILGRGSVVERCMVIRLDNYINREGALIHLEKLDMFKGQIYSVILSFIQWIACKLDERQFETEFDICAEEARECLNIPRENVRVRNMIINLYAIHLLWLKYCRAKAVQDKFDRLDIQNWILYLKQTYSYIVLTVSSRQDILKTLFIKYIQENQQNIWVVQEDERLDNLAAVAIDEDSGQIGVYISDIKGLFEFSNRYRRSYRAVLLLDCESLESGINDIYRREMPNTGEVFTQMEIKKGLRESGWMLTRPRSGKDGTNYTFPWIVRCGHGKVSDLLRPICDDLNSFINEVDKRRTIKNLDFYIRQQTCIAINMDTEIGSAVKWEILQNMDDRKHVWRTLCVKNKQWTEKLRNTLGDIWSATNKK